MLLQEAARQGVDWPNVPRELLGFAGLFSLYGAAGFGLVGTAPAGGFPSAHGAPSRAWRTASGVGIGGVLLSLVATAIAVASGAAEKGQTFGEAFAAGGSGLLTRLGLLALALVGFLLARAGRRAGWWVALAAGVALALRALPSGKWPQLVNPLHVMAGGLWLGTLFVLVVAVFPVVLRGEVPGGRGGTLVAAVIARFSRLALFSSALLAITGVITAWRHLKYVAALWTTPYGWALDVKLLLVATVVTLGAFNWKRVSPGLGTESGTRRLDRSSRAELTVAGLVLIVTAILISLPAPRRPAAAPGAPVAAAPTAPTAP